MRIKQDIILLLTLIASLTMPSIALGNVNTMRPKSKTKEVRKTDVKEIVRDSVKVVNPMSFKKGAITIKGYSKRASDARESFFLTNHTELPIGLVMIRVQYEELKGGVLHERTVKVPC